MPSRVRLKNVGFGAVPRRDSPRGGAIWRSWRPRELSTGWLGSCGQRVAGFWRFPSRRQERFRAGPQASNSLCPAGGVRARGRQKLSSWPTSFLPAFVVGIGGWNSSGAPALPVVSWQMRAGAAKIGVAGGSLPILLAAAGDSGRPDDRFGADPQRETLAMNRSTPIAPGPVKPRPTAQASLALPMFRVPLALPVLADARPPSLPAPHGEAAEPTRRRLPRRRHGFTLVEMLVSLTITLIMMGAVVTLFQVMADSVSASRAMIELGDRMRSCRNRLQTDLIGATAKMTPPMRPEDDAGYFEIIEGPANDCRLPRQMERQSYFGAYFGSLFGDVDDVIMFTVRSRGEPFVGKANRRRRSSLRRPKSFTSRPTRATLTRTSSILLLTRPPTIWLMARSRRSCLRYTAACCWCPRRSHQLPPLRAIMIRMISQRGIPSNQVETR